MHPSRSLPPAKTMFPSYRTPLQTVVSLAADALVGRKRSFRTDSQKFISHLHPPLKVSGVEYIPACGSFLVTPNHYYRPGFGAWWIALAVSSVIPLEMHWVMTGAFTYEGKPSARLLEALSRFYLGRLARTYSFTSMPPMPPRPQESQARARAVRRLVRFIRNTENPVVGFAPEGRDILTGELGLPPPGTGRLIHHLARLGLSILPAGVYEENGVLCLNFGPVWKPQALEDLNATETDRLVAQETMRAIAALLV